MIYIPYAAILLVGLALGTFYSMYNYKLNIVNIAIKLGAILSCAVLGVVCANLSSAMGGYPVFLVCGFAFLLAGECINFLQIEDSPLYPYLKFIPLALGYFLFALGGYLYGTFNVFALLFGFAFAGGLICLTFALDKEKRSLHSYISLAILFAFLGLFLGEGLALLISAQSLATQILYFISGIFVSASVILNHFNSKNQNVMRIISNALNIVGLLLLASSILAF